MGSEMRREKNRAAQRRFRERQKMTMASLEAELEEKDATAEGLLKQIRILEQNNIVSPGIHTHTTWK